MLGTSEPVPLRRWTRTIADGAWYQMFNVLLGLGNQNRVLEQRGLITIQRRHPFRREEEDLLNVSAARLAARHW